MNVDIAFYELQELYSQIDYLKTEIDSQNVYNIVYLPNAGEELELATAKIKHILNSLAGESEE